jgi:hypothetical protein
MAYPTKPSIQTSYTAVEQALGDGTLPGQELDNDFANIKLAVDALNDFVRGVTRSDGRLGNGTVTQDTLAADILLGLAPPEPWATGREYRTPDSVFESNRFYLALSEHTSGVFADDLAAGRWVELADFTVVQAAAIAAQLAAEAARDQAVQARNEVLAVYLGSFATSPTLTPDGDPLAAGMLYFDTVALSLFVYSGTAWLSASSSISGVRQTFIYTATAGQTVFSGADLNAQSLVFDAPQLVSVFLNGVRLVQGSDYTLDAVANSVTLLVGAALNDSVQIEVFGNLNATPPEGVNVSQIVVAGSLFTGLATQAEAQDGLINGKFMSPLRVAEAVTAQRPLADQATAETGTNNTDVMTPLRTAQAVTAQVPTVLNAGGAAPIYAARAWVNFNGTGTVAIRASGNVSSITDLGVGRYSVNFTTNMQDADYSSNVTCHATPDGRHANSQNPTASSVEVTINLGDGSSRRDIESISVTIFR